LPWFTPWLISAHQSKEFWALISLLPTKAVNNIIGNIFFILSFLKFF